MIRSTLCITHEYGVDSNGTRTLRYRYTYDEANQITRVDDNIQAKTYVYQYGKGGNRVSEKIYAYTLIILLFPIRMQLKDGGSVRYKAILYSITKVHTLISENEAEASGKADPYMDGYEVEILGIKIYSNVK